MENSKIFKKDFKILIDGINHGEFSVLRYKVTKRSVSLTFNIDLLKRFNFNEIKHIKVILNDEFSFDCQILGISDFDICANNSDFGTSELEMKWSSISTINIKK